jgi:hypothetical protein
MRSLARWLIFLGIGPLWLLLAFRIVLMMCFTLDTSSSADPDPGSLSLFHAIMLVLMVIWFSVDFVPLAYLGGRPICAAARLLTERLQKRRVASLLLA